MIKKCPKPLRHFLEYGIPVVGTYDTGATMASWKDRSIFSDSIEAISEWWKRGIRRFQFVPGDSRLVCLDIDRKNGKDGLEAMYNLFKERNIPTPACLTTLAEFPAYTTTPNNGYHLYFYNVTWRQFHSEEIAPGLEVVAENHLLTAPGSMKDGVTYEFFGDLAKAPVLPDAIMKLMRTEEDFHNQKHRAVQWEHEQRCTQTKQRTLDEICETIDKQGQYSPGSSRNRYCFEVAKFASKQGFAAGEVVNYLYGRFGAPNFPEKEVIGAVESGYARTGA